MQKLNQIKTYNPELVWKTSVTDYRLDTNRIFTVLLDTKISKKHVETSWRQFINSGGQPTADQLFMYKLLMGHDLLKAFRPLRNRQKIMYSSRHHPCSTLFELRSKMYWQFSRTEAQDLNSNRTTTRSLHKELVKSFEQALKEYPVRWYDSNENLQQFFDQMQNKCTQTITQHRKRHQTQINRFEERKRALYQQYFSCYGHLFNKEQAYDIIKILIDSTTDLKNKWTFEGIEK